MAIQKYFRFPKALSDARQSVGLTQKALAHSSGLDQSYVCGLERGRRATPQPDRVLQLVGALGLKPTHGAAAQLQWAAAHDQVIRELEAVGFREATPLVSAALVAAKRLAPDEAAGLQAYLHQIADSRENLDRLAELARGDDTKGMTM